MRNSFFTNMLFLLSVISAVALAAPEMHAAVLTVRQAPADPVAQCAVYERTANLSTIGGNSTYRGTFFSLSRVGTMYDARMFDQAILALPAMTADPALNQACPNWTEIAIREAASNFTRGTVLQFSGIPPSAGIKAGPEVIFIVGFIMVLLGLVWSTAP
ncbi:hypothetical protein BDV95DRAFT_594560 [Massariosphaeria phaeospora]|uniref:ML-like domain-containing protein n=1 Tax=Massariosphaeria phaeospora TaxID=100035 RepID=A0A7C8IDJ8_9PLEO|nr:hypothetical protein BDV95DRAFT_594560 [Massariosphaeria phaeospora]